MTPHECAAAEIIIAGSDGAWYERDNGFTAPSPSDW